MSLLLTDRSPNAGLPRTGAARGRAVDHCEWCGAELRFAVAPLGQLLEICDGCHTTRVVPRRVVATAPELPRPGRKPYPVRGPDQRKRAPSRTVYAARDCATCGVSFVPTSGNARHCPAHRTYLGRRAWHRAARGGA